MLVTTKRVPVAKAILLSMCLLSVSFAATTLLAMANPLQVSAPTAPPTLTNTRLAKMSLAQHRNPQAAAPGITAPAAEPTNAQSDPMTQPIPNEFQVMEQFTGDTLNDTLWEAVTLPKGYRNNEEQAYRPSQVKVVDGKLQITAIRDQSGQWYSGEVHSKWGFTYGDFEVSVALSDTGPGVWPAAWLMGTTDHWPNGGEIDIFENVNGSPTVVGTIHAGGSNGHWQQQSYTGDIDVTKFHTYKISKRPGVISWWVDGVKYGEWQQSQTPDGGVWPFENHRNFGLLNLAIGGNWPGPSNESTPSEITMYVDYFSVKNGS